MSALDCPRCGAPRGLPPAGPCDDDYHRTPVGPRGLAETQAAEVGRKHSVQRDVEDFHRVVVGIPDASTPEIRRPWLRASLIAEETRETLEAITGRAVSVVIHEDDMNEAGGPDLVAAIDGMCDILAVVYGTAAEFGINLAPYWDEVHRTNMAKAGGPVRGDGKRLKPKGWVGPDIAGILAREMAS